MNFVAPSFFVFLGVFLPVYIVLRGRLRLAWTLAGSLFFYAMSGWPYVFLLLGASSVDYLLCRAMEDASPARRRLLVTASVCTNLGLLAFFKYAGFLWNTLLLPLAAVAGLGVRPIAEPPLPVGISFFTFQTMSYTLDVYRGTIPVERSWLRFATFAGLFPQLVSGPIVRARDLLPQLATITLPDRAEVRAGALRFCRGFLKKACLADSIGLLLVDPCYRDPSGHPPGLLCLAVLAYGFQIYLDFSGYSDMAIGLGRVMGFRFPENFDHPFRAGGPSEFWRRWHISFSTWLRDYLYISLGGNRLGPGRTLLNLMLTMLLGGLWHGASLLFVLWGAAHGLLLVIQRLYHAAVPEPLRERVPRPLRVALCFAAVTLTWIPFRAGDTSIMLAMLQAPLRVRWDEAGSFLAGLSWECWLLLGLAAGSHFLSGILTRAFRFAAWPLEARAVALASVAFWSLHFYPESMVLQPFIYFRF